MTGPVSINTCTCCQGEHSGPALSYGADAPAVWRPEFAGEPDSMLSEDLCVIRGEAFFIQGMIEIPVRDTGEVFSWGVWTSLSKQSFGRVIDRWEDPDRDREPPYFGWLSTELTPYPLSTINLRTHVHTRPPGRRPGVELEPTAHPLAVEQREGITSARVRELAGLLAG